MRGIVSGLIRMVIVILMGLVTFWPGWGLVWLARDHFNESPVFVAILALLWLMAISAVLPLTIRLFQFITTCSLLAICGCLLYALWRFAPGVVNGVPWFMWMVLVISTGIGWLLVSTPLWRAIHGIVAVQQTTDAHHS